MVHISALKEKSIKNAEVIITVKYITHLLKFAAMDLLKVERTLDHVAKHATIFTPKFVAGEL